jgi:hypothetical protein
MDVGLWCLRVSRAGVGAAALAARFAIWNKAWLVPAGTATIHVGGSSRDPNALTLPLELHSMTLAHAV